MDVSGLDGLNDTPLLAPVLDSDNPPLPLGGTPGKTRELTKKWLLQEDGLYIPVLVEKPAHPFVSLMIPLSDDKLVDSRPGVDQTWGIIATLIKQQEQLDVSQQTVDNSQVAKSAIIRKEYIDHSHDDDDDFDDTSRNIGRTRIPLGSDTLPTKFFKLDQGHTKSLPKFCLPSLLLCCFALFLLFIMRRR
jgi:hypothetical protein